MADLEKFKFLIVFGFEHHHFAIFLKYCVPKIFKIILPYNLENNAALYEILQNQKSPYTRGFRIFMKV